MGALDLFLDLTAMPTPPGEERPVADRVTAELRGLGLEVDEDGAGAEIGANAGNLYCTARADGGGTPLFLCSHMDTVPPTGPIEPVVEDGVVRNAAGRSSAPTTSLRSSRWSRPRGGWSRSELPHAGLELLFTPKEEVGLRGAAGVRLLAVRRPGGLRLRPGRADRRGRSSARRTRWSWRSRSSASPRTPEWRRRRGALRSRPRRARSRTCDSDGSTRRRRRTSASIQGGVARNIVPDRCVLNCEARSHDERKLADVVQEMLDACSFAASLAGCEVEAEVTRGFHGYRFAKDRRAGAARRGRASRGPDTSPPMRSRAAGQTPTSSTCAASRA